MRHSAIYWKGKIVIFGGYTENGRLNKVHIYNIQMNQWVSPKVSGILPPPKWYHTSTLINEN